LILATHDLPGFEFIAIEIAIAIEIDSVGCGIFLHRIASLPQSTQHRRHAIQFVLSPTVLLFLQTLAHNQDILNRRTLQGRTARNLKIPSPIPLSGVCISFSDI